jgi:hypothetical protein
MQGTGLLVKRRIWVFGEPPFGKPSFGKSTGYRDNVDKCFWKGPSYGEKRGARKCSFKCIRAASKIDLR